MMVEFWFFDDDFLKKHEGKKGHFCCFSLTLKTASFVLVQTQKAIFGKNRYVSCIYWISKFKGHSISCSQLTVKAIFVRLRKLQCFEAWEFFTAGFGRHGCQWVKQNIIFFLMLIFFIAHLLKQKPLRLVTYQRYFI